MVHAAYKCCSTPLTSFTNMFQSTGCGLIRQLVCSHLAFTIHPMWANEKQTARSTDTREIRSHRIRRWSRPHVTTMNHQRTLMFPGPPTQRMSSATRATTVGLQVLVRCNPKDKSGFCLSERVPLNWLIQWLERLQTRFRSVCLWSLRQHVNSKCQQAQRF